MNRKKKLFNTPASMSHADPEGALTQSLNMQPVTVEINAPPPIIEHDEEEDEVHWISDIRPF